jgi:lysophospholipase L1-like esterase
VILVGMVPPTLSQAGPDDTERQAALDARTEAWNAEVAKLARRLPGVRHLDVWTDWPRDGARATHTDKGWHLSEQGHARVAAAVCDAVVSLKPPARKRP